ncbi:MAG: ABC transporter ATP-binding protein, partial [Pseudomonadota bacterium]
SLSLSMQAGELLVLTGPSGSGKSTVLNLLSSLDAPTNGEVRFAGQSLSQMTPRELADLRNARFGFVFQLPHTLPHKTVLENVLLPCLYGSPVAYNSARDLALELLDYVGLSAMADHFPSTLSGGELQRVVFARALVREPQVIFADEPTGSLDAENSHRLLGLLREQTEIGKLVVMATHDGEAMKYATRHHSMDKFSRELI